MVEKNLNARFIHKHDTEANWAKAENFVPKRGELIVYDVDDNYTYERIKMGDGTTNVNELPFATESVVKDLLNITNNVGYLDAGTIA